MKNTKKILTILSLSAVVLIGCGNNDTVENTGLTVEETNAVVEEPTEDVVEEDNKIEFHSDLFVVRSNHEIYYQYAIPNYNHDEYEAVLPRDEIQPMTDTINVIEDEIINVVSKELNKNPLKTTNNIIVGELIEDTESETRPIMYENDDRSKTGVFIINKELDEFVNERYRRRGTTDMVDGFAAYEENLNNADSSKEIITTIFENDTYIVKLAPSSDVLEPVWDFKVKREFNVNDAIENLNRFAEYFETDDVQAIFEAYLGK